MVWLCCAARGQSISVGAISLLPNTPGQNVNLFVTGGAAVQGINLIIQVADGGPEAGGSIVGPQITSVNITSDTIFAGNNTGPAISLSFVQLWAVGTSTASGTVAATGKIATVTFDTTGITVGAFDLLLKQTVNGDTDFADVPANISNGLITVPEPAAATLAGVAWLILLLRHRSAT